MPDNQLNPYVRFARYISLSGASVYEKCVPLDARLFYVHSGFGEIEANGAAYKMSPNSCLIIAPGIAYHLKAPSKSITYLALNFDFVFSSHAPKAPVPPAAPERYNAGMQIEKESFLPFSPVLFIKQISSVREMLEKAEEEYTKKLAFCNETASSLLRLALIECLRRCESTALFCSQLDVAAVTDYIREHFSENITNTKIGELFGFHPNYINDMMKKATGISLHRYLLKIRIEKAVSLLESSRCTISETAELCGFKDIYYFSRYFKKETGFSPRHYIKHL